MGWAILLGLAAATLGGLWFFGVRERARCNSSALRSACSGGAGFRHLGFRGRPKAPPEHLQLPESDFAKTREDMLGCFDRALRLTISESYARRGVLHGAPPRSSQRPPGFTQRSRSLGRSGKRACRPFQRHDESGRGTGLPPRRATRPRPSGAALLLRPCSDPGRPVRRGGTDLAPAPRRSPTRRGLSPDHRAAAPGNPPGPVAGAASRPRPSRRLRLRRRNGRRAGSGRQVAGKRALAASPSGFLG